MTLRLASITSALAAIRCCSMHCHDLQQHDLCVQSLYLKFNSTSCYFFKYPETRSPTAVMAVLSAARCDNCTQLARARRFLLNNLEMVPASTQAIVNA